MYWSLLWNLIGKGSENWTHTDLGRVVCCKRTWKSCALAPCIYAIWLSHYVDCFSEFCQPLWQIIPIEEGVMGTSDYNLLVRSTGNNVGLLLVSEVESGLQGLALNVWNLMLFLGRWYQNWLKFYPPGIRELLVGSMGSNPHQHIGIRTPKENTPLPIPWTTNNLIFVSLNLPNLDISAKWTHTTCSLFYLAYFT